MSWQAWCSRVGSCYKLGLPIAFLWTWARRERGLFRNSRPKWLRGPGVISGFTYLRYLPGQCKVGDVGTIISRSCSLTRQWRGVSCKQQTIPTWAIQGQWSWDGSRQKLELKRQRRRASWEQQVIPTWIREGSKKKYFFKLLPKGGGGLTPKFTFQQIYFWFFSVQIGCKQWK